MIQALPEGLLAKPTPSLVALAVEGNGAFDPRLPGFQSAIDSTSLGDFKRCPRYYFYSMICGLGGVHESPHLTFGILMHGVNEHYAHAKAQGAEHPEALDASLAWLLETTWNRTLNRPWTSDHNIKNRKVLVQTAVWYMDNFADDPLETVILANGKPAVEVSFGFHSGFSIQGIDVLFRGHFDRIARLNGEPVISDIKTSKMALDQKWFDSWTPGNQFSLYALGGQVVYGEPIRKIIVDGIQVGVGFARFRRQPVLRTEPMVREWREDAASWITEMANCAERAHWPMNDKACDMYGGCQFRELCSRSPLARDTWARAAYRRRVWDPTIARGDI